MNCEPCNNFAFLAHGYCPRGERCKCDHSRRKEILEENGFTSVGQAKRAYFRARRARIKRAVKDTAPVIGALTAVQKGERNSSTAAGPLLDRGNVRVEKVYRKSMIIGSSSDEEQDGIDLGTVPLSPIPRLLSDSDSEDEEEA